MPSWAPWLVVVGGIVFLIYLVYRLFKDEVGSAGAAEETAEEPKDFGNGIHYFPFVDEEFGRRLSKFKSEHPDLKVTAIAPDTWGKGYLYGYWVNTEKKIDKN